jgi:hypothetical protein
LGFDRQALSASKICSGLVFARFYYFFVALTAQANGQTGPPAFGVDGLLARRYIKTIATETTGISPVFQPLDQLRPIAEHHSMKEFADPAAPACLSVARRGNARDRRTARQDFGAQGHF